MRWPWQQRRVSPIDRLLVLVDEALEDRDEAANDHRAALDDLRRRTNGDR